MYGKTKTGITGRITAGIIAVLILAVSLLTACRPVSLTQTPVPAAEYEVTGHWSETINNGKLTIKIDTDILEPKISEYPVVKVEPLIFTQQRVDELVNYFAKGRKLYKPHRKTKADYQTEIENLLIVTAYEESRVRELELHMKYAPEEYPKEYTDSTLTYDLDIESLAEYKLSGKNFLNVMVESGNGNDPKILIRNFVEGYNYRTSLFYSSPQVNKYRTEGYYITTTEEKARAYADEAINDLGIEDMMFMSATKIASRENPNSGGWILEYIRRSGGIPVYRNPGLADKEVELPQHFVPFSEERLRLLVTNNGIEEFLWDGCANIVETVSKNSELMELDEIKRKLRERIIDTNAFGDNESEQKTIKVKSARLCMGYISTDNGNALIVPVWVFEVEESYYNNYLEPGVYEHAYVISAIDGGAIQRLPRDEG